MLRPLGSDEVDRADHVGDRAAVEVHAVCTRRHHPGEGLAAGAAHRLQGEVATVEEYVQGVELDAGLDVYESGTLVAGHVRSQAGAEHLGEDVVKPVGLDDVRGRHRDVGVRPASADGAHPATELLGLSDDVHQLVEAVWTQDARKPRVDFVVRGPVDPPLRSGVLEASAGPLAEGVAGAGDEDVEPAPGRRPEGGDDSHHRTDVTSGDAVTAVVGTGPFLAVPLPVSDPPVPGDAEHVESIRGM